MTKKIVSLGERYFGNNRVGDIISQNKINFISFYTYKRVFQTYNVLYVNENFIFKVLYLSSPEKDFFEKNVKYRFDYIKDLKVESIKDFNEEEADKFLKYCYDRKKSQYIEITC